VRNVFAQLNFFDIFDEKKLCQPVETHLYAIKPSTTAYETEAGNGHWKT